MSHATHSRRQFLKTSARRRRRRRVYAVLAHELASAQAQTVASTDRHAVGFIGTGDRLPGAVTEPAKPLMNVLAVCDVDKKHLENGNRLAEKISGHPADMYEDYRKVLDRKDIDVVIVTTPDHWHSKIAIEAMQAGKDVYCEKPLTLTIDEGKKICQVQKQTNRVFQVGTQQRSEFTARIRPTDNTPGENLSSTIPAGGGAGACREAGKNQESHLLDRALRSVRSIAQGRRAGRAELGHVAGSNAAGRLRARRPKSLESTLSRQPHALRIPLVV